MNNGNLANVDLCYLGELSSKIEKGQELLEEDLRMKAGIKWREEGERSSKFFLNLIKQRMVASSMKGFLDDSARLLTGNKDIANHGFNFYSNLYSSSLPPVIDNRFFSELPELSQEQSISLGRPITIDEMKAALKTCKDSTPGLDGIPYSYYKVFGSLLLPLVLGSWNYGLITGTTAPSHRAACITIIPKAGKDIRFIRNWRPITVSACDLKVITKAIRVATALPYIISDCQMAYVPGRDINFNNCILNFVSQYESLENNYLVSFDAEKAYDSVSHDYLKAVLKRYGFPPQFIQFFSTIYSNYIATVQINGHLTNYLPINRGVKQGDALSCALFILAIDPLIRNIEANSNVPAVKIKLIDGAHVSFKVLAYADDIAILTSKSSAFQYIFMEYERLFNATGLKLNADKTELLIISNNLVSNDSYSVNYLDKEVLIKSAKDVKICGNHVSCDQELSYEKNILARINCLEKILNCWKRRNLTINGKMIIIKCFALSQITFVSQFCNIKPKDIKKIENLCYKFIHNPERVKRSTLKLPKSEGGVDGVDIECFLAAIKIRQFFKADKRSHSLSLIQWKCKSSDEIAIAARSYLYKCYRWAFNKVDPLLITNGDKDSMQRSNIRLFFKPGSKTDILLAGLDIHNYNDILHLPRGKINSIMRSVPNNFKLLISSTPIATCSNKVYCIPYNNQVKHFDCITSRETQTILKTILKKCCVYNISSKYKDLFVSTQVEMQNWTNLWLLKNPILRATRLKILYGDVFSNERRFKFGIIDNQDCPICGEIETKEHQLIFCRNASRLWNIAKSLQIHADEVNYSLKSILVTNDIHYEILKSVIFKMLIQIDRSKDISVKTAIIKIRTALMIEQKCKPNQLINNLLEKLNTLVI